MKIPTLHPMFGASLLALGITLGVAAPAAASAVKGFYEVHQFCAVTYPSTKTLGVKRELFAQIEEGALLDPNKPEAGKQLFAQIIDEHRHLKVTYQGHSFAIPHQTPAGRAFTEFKSTLEACFALQDHLEIGYTEWLKLIGTSPNTLVSNDARSTLRKAGEVKETQQKCKYLFKRTNDPEVAAKFKGSVPLCPAPKSEPEQTVAGL